MEHLSTEKPIGELSKKERRALRRLEKEEARKKERRMQQFKRIGKFGAVLVLGGTILGGGYLFFLKSKGSLGPDFSREMPFEGAEHVAEGTDVVYQSNPPTSGPHWPQPLTDGIYDREKPDEAVVHSLEHGRVWISYKPSIPQETKEILKELLKGQSAVILTPRSANEADIALAAWQRLDTFALNPDGSFEKKRILDFITRYKNKGPEFVPGNGGGKRYE